MITLLFHPLDVEIMGSKDPEMFSVETTLLGVALALDAAVVSFAIGILNLELSNPQKLSRGLMTGGLFGLFQFLMVWLGSIGGYYFSFSSYGYLFQLVVAVIFMVIGIRVLQESLKNEEMSIEWGIVPMLILAFATSIDALASGVAIGTLPETYLSAFGIGIITFLICGAAYFSSNFLKSFPANWLLRVASVIFFFLGGRILTDYFL
jgi:putative Mn2+ efflux pump MntP